MQVGPQQSVQLMYDGAASVWRVISGAGGSGATTYVTQTLATSSVSYIPQLMGGSQLGNAGVAFIYRNQIYTMGAGASAPGVAPYGINDTTTNNAFTPALLPVAATTSAPNGPSGWSEIVGNNQTACAVSNVGMVYCWGLGTTGQTGTGLNTTNYTATPISFPAPATSIVKIFTSTDSIYSPGGGTNSFFAIDSIGQVFAWGYNSQGVLGDGTQTSRPSPVQVGTVPFNGKTITKISVSNQHGGYGHVAAIDSTGQLYTWGHNADGQLGRGNATTPITTPEARAGFTDVVDVVATGGYNTTDGDSGNIFVLKGDGTVWASGSGNFGQLGNGANVSTSTFVQATGLTGITKIYAAPTHWGAYAMAVNASGQVYAVGANAVGNLGTGNTTQYNTYQLLSGGFTGKSC
jgi:alpha-tubulin suppressor-like RCC1 family protein